MAVEADFIQRFAKRQQKLINGLRTKKNSYESGLAFASCLYGAVVLLALFVF